MGSVLILAVVFALGASGAYAQSCKDPTTGQFVICPAATATATTATKPLLTLLLKEVSLQSRRLPPKLLGERSSRPAGPPARELTAWSPR